MSARLPRYMTPAYLEQLPFIPTLVSNKADRALLPRPPSLRLPPVLPFVPLLMPIALRLLACRVRPSPPPARRFLG